MHSVVITSPDGQQRRMALGDGGLRIGRAPDNDLVVPAAGVALYHAIIRASAEGRSRLGGADRSGAPLLIEVPAGDEAGAAVRIGGYTIRLSAPAGSPAA